MIEHCSLSIIYVDAKLSLQIAFFPSVRHSVRPQCLLKQFSLLGALVALLNAILSIVVMIPFDTLNNRLFFIGPLNAVISNAVEFVFDLKTSAAQASKCTNNRHAVDITALFVDIYCIQAGPKFGGNLADIRRMIARVLP